MQGLDSEPLPRAEADPPESDTGRGAWMRACVFLLLALGIGLRATQYFGHVDMWHDELALARNVEDRGLVELVTRPLDHLQVAPVGALALLDVTATLVGVSEAGLRLGPWILGIVALLLFWRVASRFAEGVPLCAALAMFAVSPAMVWYGASLKPYGGDVAVSLFLVWLSLRYLERPGDLQRGALAGAMGGAALLLSLSAVPTAAILGVVLVLAWWQLHPRPALAPLAGLGVGWMLGAALAGGAALRLLDPATDEFMRVFWAEDFPPAGPVAALTWAAARLYETFAHSLIFVPPQHPVLHFLVGLPMTLAVVGIAVAVRQRNLRAALLLVPPAAGLVAAFVHLMPFDQRVGLHAGWPVLVLAAFALTHLRRILPGQWRLATHVLSAVMAIPLLAIVLLGARPPYHPPYVAGDGSQPRAVLEELAERRLAEDRVYVYTQGRHDMAFYGTRAGIEQWTQGDAHFDDPRGYLREVDALRGTPRAWFFWVQLDDDEPALIRSYLEAIGRELERIPDDEFAATGAVLYDLSDPQRLVRASAASFPLDSSETGQEQ